MKRNKQDRVARSTNAEGLALLRIGTLRLPRTPKFVGNHTINDQVQAIRRAAEADGVDLVQTIGLWDDEYSADFPIPEAVFQTARFHGLTKVYMVDRRCLCFTAAELPHVETYCQQLLDAGIEVVEAPIEEPL
jgi:hypothetical protein